MKAVVVMKYRPMPTGPLFNIKLPKGVGLKVLKIDGEQAEVLLFSLISDEAFERLLARLKREGAKIVENHSALKEKHAWLLVRKDKAVMAGLRLVGEHDDVFDAIKEV